MLSSVDFEIWLAPSDCVGLPDMQTTSVGTWRALKKLSANQPNKVRPRQKGKGDEYHISLLPAKAQAALLLRRNLTSSEAKPAALNYDRESLWTVFERKSNKQKAAAKARVAALNTAFALVDTGVSNSDAFTTAADAHHVDRSTLYRWYEKVKSYDRNDWLAALVAQHVCNVPNADCSREAWEFFKADYLRLEQPTVVDCYARLSRAAQAHGWTIPSSATLTRRIKKEIPHTQITLLRQGEQALYQLYPPLERSVSELHAMQWINGDGYKHNVFVRWPDGSIERPKTWFWQDIYSRKLLSYRVDKTENTDTLRQSFGQIIEQYGIPEHATIDNTRAAANKWMTGGVANRYRFKVKEDDPIGIMVQLNIKVHWTSVFLGHGSGQSKPIERQFGVGGIGESVDKHPAFAGAYTGKNPMAKPENYASKAIDLATFEAVLAEEIKAINARVGRRTEMCDGIKSYDQAFNESYSQASIKKATAAQRRLWLLPAEAIKVDKHGTVTLQAGSGFGMGKNRYGCDALLQHCGEKVVVRFDPQNLHSNVHVETLDGRFISEAVCLVAAGFGDTERARPHNLARKQFIKANKAAAKAQKTMQAIEAAELLPSNQDPEPPTAAVVQGVFVPAKAAAASSRDVNSVFLGLAEKMQQQIKTREGEKL